MRLINIAVNSSTIPTDSKIYPSDMHQDQYEAWGTIVTSYSGRSLTYGSDLFSALSGIASEFQKLLSHDEYKFGMWCGDMFGLLWETLDFQELKPDELQIPSWSWASERSSVRCTSFWSGSPDSTMLAHASRAQIVDSPIARHITCRLVKLDLVGKAKFHGHGEKHSRSSTEAGKPAFEYLVLSYDQAPEMSLFIDLDPWYSKQVQFESTEECLSRLCDIASAWVVLPIFVKTHHVPYVVLLERDNISRNGCYHRIGRASLHDYSREVKMGELERLILKYHGSLEEQDYLVAHDTGEVTIALV